MNRRTLSIALGASVLAAGLSVFVVSHRGPAVRPVAKQPAFSVPSLAQPEALKSFVAKHEADRRPEVQDQVGAAKLRLGYVTARAEGYGKARAAFLEIAKVHRGTGAQSAAFGGVADQAAYQAIACLAGEGKTEQARTEFEKFMRERPLSPLVNAAYRRLIRLNGGESRPEWDQLLQSAITQQEKRIRFETSVCGPKCLEKLLAGKHSYKELAKLCGTTDDGTTVAGMRKGLHALGIESWAYQLNRQDLAKVALPAVMLEADHYVLLEKVEGDSATLWDPRDQALRTERLPSSNDPDFTTTLILLSKPEGL